MFGLSRELKFTVKYDSNAKDCKGTMRPTVVTFGADTRLRKNRFSRPGYEFVGWTAYRESDKKTCYVSNDADKTRRFFSEDEITKDWKLHIYKDECFVSKLSKVNKDTIVMKAVWEKVEEVKYSKRLKVLLLTHKDSDNIGDQFIQLSNLSFLPVVFENLGFDDRNVDIIDEKAALITPQYFTNKEEAKKADKKIGELLEKCDLVMLGGAPQFNYLYQYFSERSVRYIELCQKYNKPIIFSGIGIENYDEDNPKCQRLKEALKSSCVKMVTTRDGIDILRQMVTRDDLTIAKVSDPAVWSANAFENFVSKKNTNKIGIFVIRSGAFSDNKKEFSDKDATQMYLDLINEIQSRGLDYELLTSGFFRDEAFMDHMVRDCGIPLAKCIFNMHKPEQLIERISSYAGIISCRLHPSILAYSLQVPAVGIVWNPKVSGFYNAIGYKDRYFEIDNLSAAAVMDEMEKAILAGVELDKDYICTGYKYLFNTLKELFCPENNAEAYGYDTIARKCVRFEGTTPIESDNKVIRKETRCYRVYNNKDKKLKDIIKKYNTKGNPIDVKYVCTAEKDYVATAENKPFIVEKAFCNNGEDFAQKCKFVRDGYEFVGWNIKFRMGGNWFWYLKNGDFCVHGTQQNRSSELYLVSDEGKIPLEGFKCIGELVLYGTWKKKD